MTTAATMATLSVLAILIVTVIRQHQQHNRLVRENAELRTQHERDRMQQLINTEPPQPDRCKGHLSLYRSTGIAAALATTRQLWRATETQAETGTSSPGNHGNSQGRGTEPGQHHTPPRRTP